MILPRHFIRLLCFGTESCFFFVYKAIFISRSHSITGICFHCFIGKVIIYRIRRSSSFISANISRSEALQLNSCQKFRRCKCHNLTLRKVFNVARNNIVYMNIFSSCTLYGIFKIFPLHIYSHLKHN